MGLQLIPGQLERFIGTFYRVNAKRPPARPDFNPDQPLESLVIAKGLLQIGLQDSHQVNVEIPPEDQVDQETYELFLRLLVDQLVQILQSPQHTASIMDAMQKCGLVARFDGPTLRMNPLSPGISEQDQF